MKSINRRTALAAAATTLLPGLSRAADFPERPIRILIGYAAGGGTDVVARILAPRLTEALKVPIVVENRPGAAGLIAEAAIAKAPADGYTLLMDPIGIAMNPSVYKKVPFDPMREIQPVVQVFSQPFVVVVHGKLPANNLKELVALMKAKPKEVNVAVAGTSTQLAAELFRLRAGVDATLVPYKGSAPAAASLITGETQVMFADLPSVRSHIAGGRIRALAVMGRRPAAALPGVPPAASTGVFDDDVSSWTGIFAPGGTPMPILQTLNAAVQGALRVPEVQAQLVQVGVEPVSTSVEEFTNFYRSELTRWKSVVTQAKIQPQD